MNLEELIQSLKDSYGPPKVEDNDQKITIIKDVIEYFRKEIDSQKYDLACSAIKKYHSTRYGFPDLCDCNKAIKEYEKNYCISLANRGGYFQQEYNKAEIKALNVEGEMKDFVGHFRKLLDNKRRQN